MVSEGLGYGKKALVESIVKTQWEVANPHERLYTFQELLFIVQEMLYDEGRPYFEESVHPGGAFSIYKKFVEYLLYRNLANYDSMVLVTSEKGTGKSSAAISMAREWCRKIGIRFDPARHIAYSNADVMARLETLNSFEPLICDEAVKFASTSDWALRSSKELRKRLALIRTKHLLFILCFPMKVYKLEKTYLESYVNYWTDLFGRGVGAIYVKDKNPVHDSWRLKEFATIAHYTEFTNIEKVEKELKKHPNFWTIVRFPKLPAWLYNKYLSVREKNIYDDDNVFRSITKEDINNALLILTLRDLMAVDNSVTMNRLLLHIKNTHDISLTKSAIDNAVNDAKQLVLKIKEKAVSYEDK